MDFGRVLWCELHDGSKVAIGRQKEEHKFFFTLSCGRHHHLRTTNAVDAPRKLLCTFCEPARRLTSASVRLPTEIERDMHASFQRAGVTDECVRETKLPCWHGQVDFWFPAAGVIVQVDGPRHFNAEARIKPAQRQATRDINMCKKAWAAGWGVVRVHHLQAGSNSAAADVQHALQLRRQTPNAPVLILTAGFTPAPGAAVAGQRDAGEFIAALESAFYIQHSVMANGSLLFCA